jgi:hypothetical protein
MENNKNDENEKDFPGYPHYPASEDIMNVKGEQRIDADVEDIARSKNILSSDLPPRTAVDKNTVTEGETDINAEPDDADVTADDLIALEGADTDPAKVDLLEGENDLDVPGAEEDDTNEEIGEEDEENNYYSLGGDAHENLEEDQGD